MLNKDLILKRLALIKYLYKIGLEQSRQSETIAGLSILSFHDSIEMYLKLLSEHKNTKSDNFNFMDYWSQFTSLSHKESMRSLNARRVNLKHKGLLPSKTDIEISRVNTTDFFEQNTLREFGFDFKNISLVSMVVFTEAKKYLEKAEKSLSLNNTEDCIEFAAIAFNELISSYEDTKLQYYYKSPFFIGEELPSIPSFHSINGLSNGKTEQLDRFFVKVKESINEMQYAIKIISLGIDFKQYAKFKLLTPLVTKLYEGHHVSEICGKKKWTIENCQYCIDFVINSALKLQEFDFNLNEIENDEEFIIEVIDDNENK